MNILVNAAHAIEKEGTITIDTSYENNELKVKIKDTGCGIKEPDKIFLCRVHNKRSRCWNRLRACYFTKIIEKHKGTIEVKTKLGKGSEFIITIYG